MSLQFLRNLNKNVKESLSAINEGLELTNGVAEVSELHLPYLLQLHPKLAEQSGTAGCCVFQGGYPALAAKDSGQHGRPTEGIERTTSRASFLRLLRENRETPEGNGPDKKDDLLLDVPEQSSPGEKCALGDDCLLRQLDAATYEGAVASLKEFIDCVENALETQSPATRHLLETQALPVLCNIVALAEAVDHMRKYKARLSSKLNDLEALSGRMLEAVGSSMRQILKLLGYPEGILKDRSRCLFKGKLTPKVRGINMGKMNDGANPTVVRYGGQGASPGATQTCTAYEYLGEIGVLSISPQEKERIQNLLALYQSVGIATGFGRSVMTAATVCLGGDEILERRIVETALDVIERLYSHNDIGWYIHKEEDHSIYTVNKLDHFYTNWQWCCSGLCFHCNRALGIAEIPESLASTEETYCECIIRSGVVSPNRHLIDHELLVSQVPPYVLMKTLKETNDMAIKTKATKLLLQMVLNSGAVAQSFVESGCVPLLLEQLQLCYIDQFAVINEALMMLSPENWEKSTSAVDQEITIGTSFVPCYIEFIMILRHCLQTVGANSNDLGNVIKVVAELAMTMISVFVYISYCGKGVPKHQDGELFNMVLSVVTDILCSLLTLSIHGKQGLQKPEEKRHCELKLHLAPIVRLIDPLFTIDEQRYSDLIISGVLEQGFYTIHLICSETRFGYPVDTLVFNQLVRLVDCFYMVSKGNQHASQVLGLRLATPVGENMPPLYRCLYNEMQMKDIEALKTAEVTSPHQALLNQLRMETIGDLANVPIIVHWMLLLLDPDAQVPSSNVLVHHTLEMIATCGDFDGDQKLSSIMDYAQLGFEYALKNIDNKAINNIASLCARPMELAIKLLAAGRGETLKKFQYFIDPWLTGTEIMQAAMKAIETQFCDRIYSLMVEVASLLVAYLCIIAGSRENNELKLVPLIDILNKDGINDRFVELKFVVAFVITLTFAFGAHKNEVMDVGLIVSISENLKKFYNSDEHRYATMLLSGMEGAYDLDPMISSKDHMLTMFHEQNRDPRVPDAIGMTIWDRQNLCEFSLCPYLHRSLRHFRRMLHGHFFDQFIIGMRNYQVTDKTASELGSVSKNDEIERMRRLHAETTAFAQDRLAKMTSQLNVMADSYFLAEEKLKSTREELEIVLAENLALREQLQQVGFDHK